MLANGLVAVGGLVVLFDAGVGGFVVWVVGVAVGFAAHQLFDALLLEALGATNGGVFLECFAYVGQYFDDDGVVAYLVDVL